MFYRTYNLRTRTGAGLATQADRVTNIPPSNILDTPPSEVASPNEGIDPNDVTTAAICTYSDVVAARAISPRREKPVGLSKRIDTDDEGSRSDSRSDETRVSSTPRDVESIDVERNPPSKDSEAFENQEGPEWTTVRRRRACSHSPKTNKRPLTSEQQQIVRKAAESLTHGQKRIIERRQEKLRAQRDASVSSRGEGPSRPGPSEGQGY
jgi:hypothetical protein